VGELLGTSLSLSGIVVALLGAVVGRDEMTVGMICGIMVCTIIGENVGGNTGKSVTGAEVVGVPLAGTRVGKNVGGFNGVEVGGRIGREVGGRIGEAVGATEFVLFIGGVVGVASSIVKQKRRMRRKK
jgi:hypothetical protein